MVRCMQHTLRLRSRAKCCTVGADRGGAEVLQHGAGDVLEVRTYERLLPLVAQGTPLGSLARARRGDCLVAFSRRDVHAVKRAVDSHGALRCCVVYGALPAEVRAHGVGLPFLKPYLMRSSAPSTRTARCAAASCTARCPPRCARTLWGCPFSNPTPRGQARRRLARRAPLLRRVRRAARRCATPNPGLIL